MSKFLRHLCLLLCLLFFTACQSAPKPQGTTVQVERVLSGQTVEVVATPDQVQRVRLLGIEAPDLDQEPWGTAARDRLTQLVGNATVLLELPVTDQNNQRLLAYLWRDGVLINEQLVAEGLVLVGGRSPDPKYVQRLAQAQEKARALGLGIWNPAEPMRQSPAEFRQKTR